MWLLHGEHPAFAGNIWKLSTSTPQVVRELLHLTSSSSRRCKVNAKSSKASLQLCDTKVLICQDWTTKVQHGFSYVFPRFALEVSNLRTTSICNLMLAIIIVGLCGVWASGQRTLFSLFHCVAHVNPNKFVQNHHSGCGCTSQIRKSAQHQESSPYRTHLPTFLRNHISLKQRLQKKGTSFHLQS